jgi:hypothetical protein
MSLFDYMKQDVDPDTEAPPPEYARPYHHLLQELADGIEKLYPGQVEATVRRTPVAGGWEVLVWPWRQAEVRISLVAAYPSEDGVQMYNRIYTTKEAFERALQSLWSSPSTKECIAGLRERSALDVEGRLRLTLLEGAEPVALTLSREGFRALANGAEGAPFEGLVRQEAYQVDRRTGPAAPPLLGTAEFSRHLIHEATLNANLDEATRDRWPYRLSGTRGVSPRRPYSTH